jgi:hypothetical protein
LSSNDQKANAQRLLKRALKDIIIAAKLLDAEDILVLRRLRNLTRDIKIAEAQLR